MSILVSIVEIYRSGQQQVKSANQTLSLSSWSSPSSFPQVEISWEIALINLIMTIIIVIMTTRKAATSSAIIVTITTSARKWEEMVQVRKNRYSEIKMMIIWVGVIRSRRWNREQTAVGRIRKGNSMIIVIGWCDKKQSFSRSTLMMGARKTECKEGFAAAGRRRKDLMHRPNVSQQLSQEHFQPNRLDVGNIRHILKSMEQIQMNQAKLSRADSQRSPGRQHKPDHQDSLLTIFFTITHRWNNRHRHRHERGPKGTPINTIQRKAVKHKIQFMEKCKERRGKCDSPKKSE